MHSVLSKKYDIGHKFSKKGNSILQYVAPALVQLQPTQNPKWYGDVGRTLGGVDLHHIPTHLQMTHMPPNVGGTQCRHWRKCRYLKTNRKQRGKGRKKHRKIFSDITSTFLH